MGYFEDEVMITETATHRPEEETLAGVSLPETTTAEGDIEDSELITLPPKTIDELPEHLSTTESIYEETATDETTTKIPDGERQADQPTIIDIEDSRTSDELNTLRPETFEEQ